MTPALAFGMITEDQTAAIEFLAAPETHGGAAVERIDTHASVVFLAGTRAWKLKRAVRYDYLDFSTAERRRAMCEAEVCVNRRTAPSLYRGVVAIVRRRDGSLALGGAGSPVDWVVEMNRFNQDGLFDRLAVRDALGLDLMPRLAVAIAQFHMAAERLLDHGGRAGMAWVIGGNARGFGEEGAGILDPAQAASLTTDSRDVLARHAVQLDRRCEAGFVRRCHGDLHLRNIVLIDGHPTLFDGIEFNDEVSCIDVLYDFSFLLMDLWRRRLHRHANAVLNTYLSETLDFEGVSLLPLFLSCRSAVRAKTSAAAAMLQTGPARRRELEETARSYLALAATLLRPAPPCLIAIGGFSGSGKSTLAHGVAPSIGAVPGALVIRSDEVRKQLCKVSPLTRLGPAGYTGEVTRRVYETVARRAATIVRAGHSVIVDAVFARSSDRDAVEQVAEAAGVPFVGLWLEAPEQMLIERSRRRLADPSDADPAIVRAQVVVGAGEVRWNRILASGEKENVLQRAISVIEQSLAGVRVPAGPASG
jgi:aminoglycoside phosphotransferase family enzyme/predicted kinase